MLTKLHIYIIFLPFISALFSSFLFLFFQLFLNKKYFSNLQISFFITFFLFMIVIYELSPKLSDQQIFYSVFVYLCSSYIFVNLIQLTVSSLQLTILRIIYLNPGISRKSLIKKYNSSYIFEERITTAIASIVIGIVFFIYNKI